MHMHDRSKIPAKEGLKTEGKGIGVVSNGMYRPRAIHEETHEHGVMKGKWHVAVAAVLLSCIHDSRRAVRSNFSRSM